MVDLLKQLLDSINLFDIFFLIVLSYNVIQCFLKGFSLSLILFMKWVLSTIVTIILVPKVQPFVSNYIQSEFINNIGLGVTIFIFTLFITVLIGKTLSRTITWTGVGSIDKGFGLLFGLFKGYVVAVCLFSILVLSNFIPTIYFGVFTGIAMLLAMISVLTLLPKLILTFKPFGKEIDDFV